MPNPDGTWDLRVTGPKLPGAGRISLNLMGDHVANVLAQALYYTRWREEGMGTEPYGGLPNPWRWWRGRRARKREVPRVTGILTTRLERAVEDEFAAHRGSYPNPPGVNEYRRHAETLGLLVQEVCTALDSSSGYYDVIAIYEPGPPIFGREPLALCFEDSSKSIGATWMLVQPT